MAAPRTKLNRTYWTRQRVITGLRRFWLDTGQAPTSNSAYFELAAPSRQPFGTTRPGPYPSTYGVARWFTSFREAWGAAGIQQDRYWEPWSELEDWYLREGAGLLTRQELGADLRRSPDAVHRRLYDLGIHTWQRWGWTPNRFERVTGITGSVLRKYMRCGEIPYLRGSKVLYMDPADFLAVLEVDWVHPPAELERAVRHSLQQRIVATLSGRDWRAGRPYQVHRETTRRYRPKFRQPSEPPTSIVAGMWVSCTRAVASRPTAFGRTGLVQVVFWSSIRNRLREQAEPGWFARVEFKKQKQRGDGPRVTYTLPIDALEVSA